MSKASTVLIPSQVAIHPQPLAPASTILYRECSNCQTKGQRLCCPFLVRNCQEYKESAMLSP